MTKKKTKVQEPQCPDYTHLMTKELCDLLHIKQEDRYNRFEAFRYLIEKQAKHCLAQSAAVLIPFTSTITQLSIDWQWHRHTVTAFLEDLQLLDILTVVKTREGVNICFNHLSIPSLA